MIHLTHTAGSEKDPRDATRGGVNGPALPVQRGRESPLSIDKTVQNFLKVQASQPAGAQAAPPKTN